MNYREELEKAVLNEDFYELLERSTEVLLSYSFFTFFLTNRSMGESD